jgi:hypothetical protein
MPGALLPRAVGSKQSLAKRLSDEPATWRASNRPFANYRCEDPLLVGLFPARARTRDLTQESGSTDVQSALGHLQGSGIQCAG